MNLKLKNVFASLTCLALLLLFAPFDSVAQSGKDKQGVKVIVLDAGHGGSDPGAVYGKGKDVVREKTITLKVALLLGDMIEKNLKDVKVVYTRKTDVAVPLYKRGEIANKANGDLFVSIHVNSLKDISKAPSGNETYIMSPEKEKGNLDVAMRENDVVVYEEDYETQYMGFVPGSPESYIIFSLMQYVNVEQSLSLASTIQKNYKSSVGIHDRGVKRGPFLVLWTTKMPSVLTEIGFLPNATDRKLMTTNAGQKKIATSLFNAISEYKAKVEGNSKPITLVADASPAGGTTVSSQTVSTSANNKTIVYRIQVCTSPSKVSLSNSTLRPYKGDIITERKVGGVYKYLVGECHTYEQAREKQAEVRKTTKDAFMVAFEGNDQISVSEARRKE